MFNSVCWCWGSIERGLVLSCKRSDDAVLGRGRSTGIVAGIEVGMSQYSVDRSGLVRVDEDIHLGL